MEPGSWVRSISGSFSCEPCDTYITARNPGNVSSTKQMAYLF